MDKPVLSGKLESASSVVEGAAALLADKGYDSDVFIQMLIEKDIEPITPPRNSRINTRDCD